MKVGVDARLLAETVTGVGRYTIEMTRELIRQQDEYHLYLPFQPPDEMNWRGPRVQVRHGNYRGQKSKFLWSQTVLPWWATTEGVDLFWGPYRIPRVLPPRMARVITIHDLVWRFFGETMVPYRRWIESRLVPRAVRSADLVVCVSTSTAEVLQEEFPEARGKTRVVHLGVTARPAAESRETLASLGIDRPYFLFVGTLEPRKNLIRLLKAYSMLDPRVRRDTLLVIAGGRGWGNVNTEDVARDLGIGDTVRLTGYVSEAQLSTLYAHARFLAMPSINEGFGLPIIEAGAAGVPALTSDVSSMPEVAGTAALLIDPLREESIASGLNTLLTDEPRLAGLAAQARPNAARFNWEKSAQAMRAIFEEAIARRRG